MQELTGMCCKIKCGLIPRIGALPCEVLSAMCRCFRQVMKPTVRWPSLWESHRGSSGAAGGRGEAGSRAHPTNQGVQKGAAEAPKRPRSFNHIRTLREKKRVHNGAVTWGLPSREGRSGLRGVGNAGPPIFKRDLVWQQAPAPRRSFMVRPQRTSTSLIRDYSRGRKSIVNYVI